ncbi:MAG: acyl-CoA dehydrogenase family protein [Dehalococcoidia bacterium]|nr:acyl-CoA dehydrogenase family protein [Dehalococcoidia bacterium]MCB9491237.1 acyl-CoA dehydrogenase family protein [Dehalococcoidia bacterium]
MDWNDSPAQAEFRAEVRALIEQHLPERYRRGEGPEERAWEFDRKSDDPAARQAAVQWQQALIARRWVAPEWPEEFGGAGLTPDEQFVLNQEFAAAGAPPVGGSGVRLLGPTLIVHGSQEQKAKYLPAILNGETAWAQGYSEPGSGSDLASLQTSAKRDGDEYVVNGQKIWTSGAHTADAIFALVRTEPEAPKHRGISFLLIDDIKTPGLSVRPLIDMGEHHYFNETFFEDVRVPAANLVGEENRGWYVAMTLLDFERSNIVAAVGARKTITELIEDIHAAGVTPSDATRGAIADRYVETEVMFNFSFRIISMQNRGIIPNYEASTSKLFASELNQRLALSATRAFGLAAMRWDDGTAAGRYTNSYIRMVPATIRGGTSEVQRNVIATRGLGLPRG